METVITDYGAGIPEIHHEKIFDKFYQINPEMKQTYPGLGIGLYIASEIIKQHGGKIYVESEENRETNFTFTLPIHDKE